MSASHSLLHRPTAIPHPVLSRPQKAAKILTLHADEQRVFAAFQFDPRKFAERVYQDLHAPDRIADFDAYYRPYFTTQSPKPVSHEAFRRTRYSPSHPVIYQWLNPDSIPVDEVGTGAATPSFQDIQFLLWEELVGRVVGRQKQK